MKKITIVLVALIAGILNTLMYLLFPLMITSGATAMNGRKINQVRVLGRWDRNAADRNRVGIRILRKGLFNLSNPNTANKMKISENTDG